VNNSAALENSYNGQFVVVKQYVEYRVMLCVINCKTLLFLERGGGGGGLAGHSIAIYSNFNSCSSLSAQKCCLLFTAGERGGVGWRG
jgi:hypothetical protein